MSKTAHIFLLICVILFFAFCACENNTSLLTAEEKEWLTENDNLKVAISPYHEPYLFNNSQGAMVGVFIDHLKLLEENIGYTFKRLTYQDWAELMADAKQEEFEIILEIQSTKKRKKFLNFYPSIFESSYVIVTRKDVSYGSKISDFYHKEVLIPKDYSIQEVLVDHHPKLKIITKANDLECLKSLNSGEHDAFIGPKAMVNTMIHSEGLNNLKILSKTDYLYQPSISVAKDNIMLNLIVEKGLASINRNQKQQILDNWFYNLVIPYYQQQDFWIFIVVFIGVLLISTLFLNRYLKFKIIEKTEELQQAKELAEEGNRLKTNFINTISHEIRTPLNGIMGFSQLMKDSTISNIQQQSYLNNIISSGKQLVSIIDDILEIAELNANKIIVTTAPTNLDKLISTLVSIFKVAAEDKNLKIQLKNKTTFASTTLILIDNSKLNKILSHLIDNAIKFTDSGEIQVSYEINDKHIIVAIKDTGIGIKDDHKELIFNSFSSIADDFDTLNNGLGLGLTIAKENINLLGGTIKLVSEVNIGSLFEITIPYESLQKELLDIPKLHDIEVSLTADKINTILIVDDVNMNYKLVKIILSKNRLTKYTILRAINGKEAVEICANDKSIDLVIMDIRMPIMDGYEATDIIKKTRPELPIIAHTAYSTKDDIKKALHIGCNDFLPKPVDSKALQMLIKKYS